MGAGLKLIVNKSLLIIYSDSFNNNMVLILQSRNINSLFTGEIYES